MDPSASKVLFKEPKTRFIGCVLLVMVSQIFTLNMILYVSKFLDIFVNPF